MRPTNPSGDPPRPHPSWRRYLRPWGPDVGADVDAELEFHLHTRIAEYVAQGMTPDAARRRAQERFGEVTPVRDACVRIAHRRYHRTRRTEMLHGFVQDLRFAGRTLRRQRLPVAIAVACLTLGIGATTTVFSVANTLLLRPLPFPNGDRMVSIGTLRPDENRPGVNSFPDFADWRARQRVFTALGAVTQGNFTLRTDREPIRLAGASVTAGFFPALGVRPELGRLFTEDEDRPGGQPVVLVSRGLAERQFGGAGAVLGRAVVLGGTARTIIGVMPDHGRFPESAELWVPLALDPARESRGNQFLGVIAALRPDVPLDRARREMVALAKQIAREHPETFEKTVRLTPLRERYVAAARPSFLLMSAAAGLLFLIACSNVAAVQLARAASRVRELAVRSALGGSRWRLFAQLLTENLILAVAGGGAGIWLAVFGSRVLASSVAGNLPPWMTFGVDASVLTFTLVASVAAGVFFGIAPALRLAGVGPLPALAAGGRHGLDTTKGRLYRGLIVAEVALSLVLLVGASLAVRSFLRLRSVDPGLDPRGVMTFRVVLQGARYDSAAARRQAIAQIEERLQSIPGVVSAGASTHMPIGGCCSRFGVRFEGSPAGPAGEVMITGSLVTPGFFRAVGVPIVRGRALAESDGPGAPQAAVVSESFAATHWPGREALGQRLYEGDGQWTVVGIARDVKQVSLSDAPEAQFYRPHARDPWESMTFAVRAPGRDASSLATEIRRIVAAVDPSLPAFAFQSMTDRLTDVIHMERLYGLLFAGFAVAALVLATAGIYGVTAYYVAQRTREIGVRLAIGAGRERVLAHVLQQSGRLAGAGVVLGLVASVAAARALAAVLYGVRADEPLPYLAAATLLAITVVAASWVPARRAARLDPAAALRAD